MDKPNPLNPPAAPAAPAASLTPELRTLLKEIISEVIPASVGASARANLEHAAAQRVAQSEHVQRAQEKCAKCGQLRIACGDEHEMMIVYPLSNQPDVVRWFQGIWINGVRYYSRHGRHRVCVPKKNDIATMLDAFVRSEEVRASGRAHMIGAPADQPLSPKMMFE